jgi:hypothetical protein
MSIIRRLFSGRVVLAGALSSLLVGGGATLTTPPAQAAVRPGCPLSLSFRTAEQTIREHLAHLAAWQSDPVHNASELDKAMCDYAEEAAVVLPIPTNSQTPATGTVVTGLDNIRGGLTAVLGLLGNTVPTVETLTPVHSTVMITFTAFGTPCAIPDGSDTYVVVLGHIFTQTVHDTFVCPMP